MIVELTVENLAIIEHAQLILGSGLTVLTGETGAGKSLLIDAIELALGERADSELVRTGAARANVHVVFDLSSELAAQSKCQELGISLEDETLFVQREVASEGRSQCRLGGKLTPVTSLRQLGKLLVDLHGQHDHQSLLDPTRHVGLLDDWIGQPARDLLSEVADQHRAAIDARRKLQSLLRGLREREQRLDLLRYQVNEIESVSPRSGELAELEGQLSRLQHVEKLSNAAFVALEGLADADDCAADRLGAAIKSLEDALRYDSSLEECLQPIREALILLEDGIHGLRSYAETLDSDPGRLDEVSTRIDVLRKLRRKYGEDEDAILSYLEAARAELDLIEGGAESEAELSAAAVAAEAGLLAVASRLSALRKERAYEFAGLVTGQLRDLAMDRAVFDVGFAERTPDGDGMDDVEFIFSANAGEPPRPLSKIASGGEISRVMLAIKSAMAGRAGVPCLIFDEVDAGLGGRAAATVARKLEELARHYQVVVISHLPQIASRAATHYRIEKAESNGRAVTQVRLLTADERVDEIARMLAGEHVTESARANAREMIGLL